MTDEFTFYIHGVNTHVADPNVPSLQIVRSEKGTQITQDRSTGNVLMLAVLTPDLLDDDPASIYHGYLRAQITQGAEITGIEILLDDWPIAHSPVRFTQFPIRCGPRETALNIAFETDIRDRRTKGRAVLFKVHVYFNPDAPNVELNGQLQPSSITIRSAGVVFSEAT